MDKETERRNRLPIRPIMGGDGGNGEVVKPYTIRLLEKNFTELGFDPRIVDRLSTWGELESHAGRGFRLFIPSRGGDMTIEFVFFWSDRHLHYRTGGVDITLNGFDKLSIERGKTNPAMRGALKVEGSFEDGSRRGKNVVWLRKSGELQLTRRAKRG